MNKLTKFNNWLADFIIIHMRELYLCAVIVISVLVRYKLFKFESNDMLYYYVPWMDEIAAGGGFATLKNCIGDYNIPYMVILTIIASVTDDVAMRIFMMKLVSALFDYLLAFFVYMVLRRNNREKEAVLGFAAIILNPIILLNSAFWGQCDMIYVFFLMVTLYFCTKEKWGYAFVFMGIAVAFKLQAAFFMPILMLFWVKKKFNFLYFLLIPVINFVMCLPAIIAGRPLLDIFGIYGEQVQTARGMAISYPNVWVFFWGSTRDFYWVSYLMTIFILGSGFYCFLNNKVFKNSSLIALSSWCLWTCVLFLPSMHERYGLTGEILLLLYALLYRKYFGVCVGVHFVILFAYSRYLFQREPISIIYTSMINLLLYLYFSYTFFKKDVEQMEVYS